MIKLSFKQDDKVYESIGNSQFTFDLPTDNDLTGYFDFQYTNARVKSLSTSQDYHIEIKIITDYNIFTQNAAVNFPGSKL